MGFVEFLGVVLVVVILTAVAVWILGKVPGVPAVVPTILWVLAVVIILYVLLAATGILGKDIRIPHV